MYGLGCLLCSFVGFGCSVSRFGGFIVSCLGVFDFWGFDLCWWFGFVVVLWFVFWIDGFGLTILLLD